jgi:hypothetical protein
MMIWDFFHNRGGNLHRGWKPQLQTVVRFSGLKAEGEFTQDVLLEAQRNNKRPEI